MSWRNGKRRTAVALVRLGKGELVWPLLVHDADPRVRSFIINWLRPMGAEPASIALEFNRIDDGLARRGRADQAARAGGKMRFNPLSSRDFDAAGVDPGPRDLPLERAARSRARASHRQASVSPSRRPGRRHPRRGRMDVAAVE